LYRSTARDRDLTLTAHVGHELDAPLPLDAQKIRQILVNMVDGAVRQARGGEVAIAASFVPGQERPLCLKVTVARPREIPQEGLSVVPRLSAGLSQVLIRGLCGMIGARFETSLLPDGERCMKVFLRVEGSSHAETGN
jgi:signal transduction histidine kinase